MSISVYLHPLSSYCQKAKTAFYEKGIPFETRLLDGSSPVAEEFAERWPIGRFPVAVDGERLIVEATGIIEYLEARHPTNPRLIPEDALLGAEVRMWDRFFDNYVNYPQQRVVLAALGREPKAADDDRRWQAAFDKAFSVLDQRMADREWVAGNDFSMADCAAAPALLYADWTLPIDPRHRNVLAYRKRLLARPSYARALEEARPYRHMFPLGAPEGRD